MTKALFTPQGRERIREALILAAHADPRLTGAALTGSAAVGREDRWSDIDLALCLAAKADEAAVVADWTARMGREHGAVHHLDVMRGNTRFRVFLLENTLQVDLAFWSASEFGATAPTFRLLFGRANEKPLTPTPEAAEYIGLAWLYALHVRSSLVRNRFWQAEYMLNHMREAVLSLICLRYGVATREGRGLDELPPEATAPLAQALVRSLDTPDLHRAFSLTMSALLAEIERLEPELFSRLSKPLATLAQRPT